LVRPARSQTAQLLLQEFKIDRCADKFAGAVFARTPPVFVAICALPRLTPKAKALAKQIGDIRLVIADQDADAHDATPIGIPRGS